MLQITRPPPSEKLAEAVGILLGDGSNYHHPKVYQVRIAANARSEEEYLLGFVKPLFDELFGLSGTIRKSKTGTGTYCCYNSKELGWFLCTVGVPFSLEKKTVGIPPWI